MLRRLIHLTKTRGYRGMKVVEGQLASLIEKILFEKQSLAGWQGLSGVGFVVGRDAAANDPVFDLARKANGSQRSALHDVVVFFA